MTTTTRRALVAAAIAAASFGAGTGTASADHGHFIYQPANGNHPATCRYIAQGQTSKALTDPGGHAFHEHVHTGQPGADDKGTDFDKASNAHLYDCVFVN